VSIWRFSPVVKVKAIKYQIHKGDEVMKYLMLIYQNEKEWAAHSEGEVQQIYQEYGKLRQELTASGEFHRREKAQSKCGRSWSGLRKLRLR
jgi:hypothetical protein